MMAATSSACASVMVVAKLFQLFQPMGGVGASSGVGMVGPMSRTIAASGRSAGPLAMPGQAEAVRNLHLRSGR
jgi:hypothetical protein